jgi:L-lactate utilization protein LutC
MSRDAFLQRVREAALRGRAWRVERHEVPANTGYVGAGDDLATRMAAEVSSVGGTSYLVSDRNAARDTLADILQRFLPRRALLWKHPLLDALQVSQLLASRQIAAFDHDDLARLDSAARRAETLAADIGITSADWGIAETGTLVMRARPGQERLASLLPPVHVAIVERSQLAADLLDVFGLLQAEGLAHLPSNITLITGPSKTGDIELQLTTGVHGPGEWHVIVVR